jgi:type I restriction enzyme, S subunit
LAEFIHYWMVNRHGGRGFLARYIYGDKPGLNLTQVASVPVPIPLESDRSRILESLRFYQSMCDRLALQFDAKHKLAAMVSFAATASITGINTNLEEEAPLKAPQTELISPLRLGQTPDIKAQAPLATILARHHGELPSKDLWQRFGGEIDAFYAQLKQEVAHGWIQSPDIAEMREKAAA